MADDAELVATGGKGRKNVGTKVNKNRGAKSSDRKIAPGKNESKKRTTTKDKHSAEKKSNEKGRAEQKLVEKKSVKKKPVKKDPVEKQSTDGKPIKKRTATKPSAINERKSQHLHKTATPDPDDDGPFMKLPPEIRCEVYQHAWNNAISDNQLFDLGGSYTISDMFPTDGYVRAPLYLHGQSAKGSDKTFRQCYKQSLLPLLQTSRVVREEIREVFFKVANAHMAAFAAQIDEYRNYQEASSKIIESLQGDDMSILQALLELYDSLETFPLEMVEDERLAEIDYLRWFVLADAHKVLARGVGSQGEESKAQVESKGRAKAALARYIQWNRPIGPYRSCDLRVF